MPCYFFFFLSALFAQKGAWSTDEVELLYQPMSRLTLSTNNLSRTLFSQNTRLLRFGTPVAALLPAEERQHATVGVLPLAPGWIVSLRGEGRARVRQLTPATGLFQHHLDTTAFTCLACGALSASGWGRKGTVECLGLSLSVGLSGDGRRGRSLRRSTWNRLLRFKGVANLRCVVRVCIGVRGCEFAPGWRRVSSGFGL